MSDKWAMFLWFDFGSSWWVLNWSWDHWVYCRSVGKCYIGKVSVIGFEVKIVIFGVDMGSVGVLQFSR